MSDYPSTMPEYQPLFQQVQRFIADQLNSDPQLSGIGVEFIPESQLDIEYGIKRNLGRQGIVGIVNTLKGQYGGHDHDATAWEIECEVDVLETPTVRRAWLKKNDLSAGTTVDVINFVQESLCGPASPTYGKFCPVAQEVGEDNGVVVGKAVVKTFAIADVSACVSGESNWRVRYATEADVSALWDAVDELSSYTSDKRDYLDLSLNVDGHIEDIDPLLPQGGVDSFYLEWTNPRGRIDTIDMVQFANEDGTMSWKSQHEPYEVTYDADTQKFNLLERGTSILEFTGLPSDGIPVQINWEWLDEPYVFDAHLKFHAISTSLATMMDLDSLSQKVETLDDLAVKYTDDQKTMVELNRPDTWVTLKINDSSISPGQSTIDFPGSNHISQKSMVIGVPPDGIEASDYGSTNVQLGGVHNETYMTIGGGISVYSSPEKGKTKVFMDDDRIFVTTPAEVSAGQTLKAVKVYDEPTMAVMTTREMMPREDPKWHWEYHSANLPDKTSDLINDSGYVTSANLTHSTIRRWEYVESDDEVTFTAEQANSTMRFTAGSMTIGPYVYRTRINGVGSDWAPFDHTSTITLPNVGDQVSFKAIQDVNAVSANPYYRFNIPSTSKISVKGNLAALLYADLSNMPSTLAPSGLSDLFNGQPGLVGSLEDLKFPWDEIGNYGCYRMFLNCTGITAPPELPATTLGIHCYRDMLNGCTALTTAPELPATTLAGWCYAGLFRNCTSLVNAPELPATTLVDRCYYYLFNNCSSLKTIKLAYAGDFNASYFDQWVGGVPASGTIYYNGDDTKTGSGGIPTGWIVQTF